MGMTPTFDLDAFPLVTIVYPTVMAPADADAYGDELDAVMQRGRIGTVVDLRKVDSRHAQAPDRKYLAETVDRVTRKHPHVLVAEAIVLDSAFLRGAYTAYWLRTDRSYPSRAFGDVAQARTWVTERLKDAGVIQV